MYKMWVEKRAGAQEEKAGATGLGPWGVQLLDYKRKRFSGFKGGGAAPDPSTQFSLFRLYMIEHPTFHSAQDDEMRRGGLKLAVFSYRKPNP